MGKELVEAEVVEQEIVSVGTGSLQTTSTIAQIAMRLKKIYPQPSNPRYQLDEVDIIVVVETTLAMGLNPLAVGKEYHAWKGTKGELVIMRHYTLLNNWAQAKEPFSIRYEHWDRKKKEIAGLPANDFVCMAFLLKRSDEEAYQKRYAMVLKPMLDSKIDAKVAIAAATQEAGKVEMPAIGRVKNSEVYTDDGKVKYGGAGDITGWIPGKSRAEIRAMRNAIRRSYGEPTAQDMFNIAHQSAAEAGMLPEQLPDMISGMPEEISIEPAEIQERYLALEAENKRSQEELDKLTDEEKKQANKERVDLMRGEEEAFPIAVEFREEPTEDTEEPTMGQIRQILVNHGYKTTAIQHSLTTKLFDTKLEDMSWLQVNNLLAYAQRANIIKTQFGPDGEELSVEDRLNNVPEIAAIERGRPTTLKAGKAFVVDLVRRATAENVKLEMINGE